MRLQKDAKEKMLKEANEKVAHLEKEEVDKRKEAYDFALEGKSKRYEASKKRDEKGRTHRQGRSTTRQLGPGGQQCSSKGGSP